MSPRTHSTSRNQDAPESTKLKSPTKLASTAAGVRLLSLRQILTMCLLPLWLVAIIVFDYAAADFRDQAFFASVRADLAELNRDQAPAEQDAGQRQQVKRTFYVDTDENGNLNGRISAIQIAGISPVEQELKIVLLQHGEEIRTTKTDAGQFTLEDVPTGDAGETYTLIASGQNGFLAYAIHVRPPVVPFDPDTARNSSQPESSYQYVSLSPAASATVYFQDQSDLQIQAAAIPPAFFELERIIEALIPPDTILATTLADDSRPQDKSLEIEGSFEYSLDDEGNFSGRVLLPNGDNELRDLSQMNVFLLQDDKEVGQDDVGENGEFKIQNVEEGVYALVAAGKDGFAALSVRLTAADYRQSENRHAPGEHYVSLNKRPDEPEFSVAIITDPDDLKYCRDTIKQLNDEDERRRAAYFSGQTGPIEFGGAPSGGFGAPSTGFGAPSSGVGASTSGGFAPIGGNGTWLRRALLGAAIALPIALGGGEEPAPMTPFETN